MKKDPKKILLILLPITALALTAMLLMRDLVYAHIVIPLYYFFWLMGLAVRSIPQTVFWMALVAVGMVYALRTLVQKKKPAPRPIPMGPRERSSRYQYWARTFFLLRASIFSLEYSSYELRRLLLNILSNQENLTFNEVEAHIQNGSIEVPEAVRKLVLRRQVGGDQPVTNWLQRTTFLIKERFFPQKLAVKTSPLDSELDIILQYIESLLEVNS